MIFLRDRTGLLAAVVSGIGVVLVLAVIWGPWIAYNHVPEPRLGPEVVAEGRQRPEEALLRELGGYDLYPPISWANDKQLVKAAEQLLVGQVKLPTFPALSFKLPLAPLAMASGPTMWQLFLHSLGLPRVLLDAYEVSGRTQFLDAAADYLVAYDAYERSAWEPGGFLWNDTWRRFPRNDHAVASRVPVLTDFWRLYRRSSNYQPEVGEAVFRMVARAAYLVADPAQFTVATNHGVMQNLAACNVELAFPTLPGIESHCRLAFTRLDEQLAFFINDEGFVLEHSPGYQSFSLRLVGIALRYMTLSKMEIPESWLRKYHAAQRVYADLRRPDGSLPVFGDTDAGSDGEGPVTVVVDEEGHASIPALRAWRPENKFLLAPVAGYALWWDGLAEWSDSREVAQTAMTWSHFPGMGHKHADELSVAMWARGTSWWANVGYWPYDTEGRILAESWEGSNAPHMMGEGPDEPRETRLLYHGRNDKLAMLDLERRGPGSNQIRRQVIQIGQRTWIILDTSFGVNESRARTIWTTSPNVRVTERGAIGEYALTDKRSGQSLRAFFLGAPGTIRSLMEGSQSPFAGWSVVEWNVQPAPSVVVERPADGGWQLASWSLSANPAIAQASSLDLAGPPRMQRWEGGDDWELILSTSSGEVTIKRVDGRIEVVAGPRRIGYLQLDPGPDVSKEIADLRATLKLSSASYGSADMSGIYRVKVTAVLLVTLVLSVIALRVVRRIRPTLASFLKIALAAGWLLMSGYFIFVRAQLI